MRFLAIIVSLFFIFGCAAKEKIVKKTNSIEKQKQEAYKAWKELDKEK